MTARPFSPLMRRLSRVQPPVILSALYGILALAGAVLLKLPIAHKIPISWSDALFTATSAVTVTGLVVVDVGSAFTIFGQIVLLVLAQLGGIGLMTFAVLVLIALGVPLGIRGQIFLREDLNQSSMDHLTALVRTIFRAALVCELVGAVLLAFAFVPRAGFWRGLWEAFFQSVSAFNNAGFSTYRDGLVSFATDPMVNIVIPALFIFGGVGYVVIQEVLRERNWRAWTLHTKIMLFGTAVLIPWSVAMFAILEWNNPLTLGQHESFWARMAVSWFQGVTPRTAGFNTTDIAALHDSTSMMFISLMLIGGGPTSTAGGIKVTTFVVMFLATIAFFRRQTQLQAFGRSIGLEQVLKVMALTAISLLQVFIGVFLLSVSHDGHFLDIAFEVASAFSTTGLSRGYTDDLSGFGRFVIMVIMFLGRVGPLTLGFFLATQATPRVRYPEGRIHIG